MSSISSLLTCSCSQAAGRHTLVAVASQDSHQHMVHSWQQARQAEWAKTGAA